MDGGRRSAQTKKIIEKTRKKHSKPGVLALLEIRRLQAVTTSVIPKRSFQRLVREIAAKLKPDVRFQSQALMALQVSYDNFRKLKAR